MLAPVATLPLSVLDVSPVAAGSSAGEALRRTIDLAQHVEALGFARYWLAEHHNAGGLACSAPEIMIGQVAAATTSIRVGSGGIMLPNHSPLKVAELFRVLSALFPGRIDLGLGRAPGTDPKTAAALRRLTKLPPGAARTGDDFPEQAAELFAYLADDGPPREPYAGGIRAAPVGVASPATWILGSTDSGARYAAEHGLPFAFAHHINPAEAFDVLRTYRRTFRPSATSREPRAILATFALCAGTAEEAEDFARGAALSTLRFARGMRDWPHPSLEEARAFTWDEEATNVVRAFGARGFVGTEDDLPQRLVAAAREGEADELMLMSNCHSHAARKASYSRLARAFGLGQ